MSAIEYFVHLCSVWLRAMFRQPDMPTSPPIRRLPPPEDDDRLGAGYEVPGSSKPASTMDSSKPASTMTRAERRAANSEYRRLEKARMKFDKWVEPKGEKPTPIKRGPRKPKAPAVPTTDVMKRPEPANFFISEHYDEDEAQPEVLYEESEFYGQFNFRDTLTDQLPRYEFYLKRMKKLDPSAYGHYKQTGMQLLPYMATGMTKRGLEHDDIHKMTPEEIESYRKQIYLPSMFKRERPAFGCVAYGANPRAEAWEAQHKDNSGRFAKWIIPRFLYYMKYSKRPGYCQPVGAGDLYKVVVWWDRSDNPKVKWGSPTEFAVYIDPAGTHIQLLRTCKTQMISIKVKRGLGHFEIPDHHWHFPEEYGDWASQWGLDPSTHLCHLFTMLVQAVEFAHYGDVRVKVQKNDIAAVFNVDSRRMSYFFKDRDYVTNAKGHRVRIFHVVAPYTKEDGTVVKMQYRGAKEFTWNGYDVTVTVPGLDHFMEDEFDVGAWDCDEGKLPKDRKFITEPELATKLVNMVKYGVGGTPR